MDKASAGMLRQFGEKFLLTGIDLGSEHFHELRTFDNFLACHVHENGIRDVQCMLLWSEWIRNYRRKAPGFPKLIHEEEFRNIITDTFGVKVADAGFRGAVYPGIRFVP